MTTKNTERTPKTAKSPAVAAANPKKDAELAAHSNLEKDPTDWVSGDEAMTGAQASYLKTLCEEAGEGFDGTMTKAAASIRIDELKKKTGRGADTDTDTRH